MDQEDDMSSITKPVDGSTGDQHGHSSIPVTTIAQIDPITVGEARSITNISSSAAGAQQLSAGDLEALANIQEELDRIAQVPNTISNQADTHDDEQGVVGVQEGITGDSEMADVGTTGVTHAMITADGRAVPITIHPETGAYMTPDGQTLVTQEVDGQQVVVASTGEPEGILPTESIDPSTTTTIFQNTRPDTSDLSSLAAAAETHQVMDTSSNAINAETAMEVDTLRTGHLDHVPVVGDFPPENILSSVPSTMQNSNTTHFVTLPSEINAMEDDGVTSYQTATGQTIRIVKKDNTNLGTSSGLQTLENANIRIINSDGTMLNSSAPNVLNQANTNIRVMNSDGTFSNLQNLQSNLPQGLRIVNSDGSLMQLGGGGAQLQTQQQIYQPISEEPQPQVQQIRIVNSDGSVTMGNTIRAQPQMLQQTVIPQQTQIKILNSDGTLSSLENSNIRIVQQPSPPQQPKVRIVHSGGGAISTGGSPIKTTMTLQQAQQMGLIPQSTVNTIGSSTGGVSNVKILPKSPTKTIRTNDGRTIVLAQSPQKQQVVIKGGAAQKVVQGAGSNQQVLRIPVSSTAVSSAGNVNVGQLQKIQIGNKIQYVRVIPSGGQKIGSQNTSVRQTQPILPSTTKGANSSSAPISLKAVSATGGQQVVKIALPTNYHQQSAPSTTKTYSGAGSQQKIIQSGPKHILPANTSGRTIAKLEVDANTGNLISDHTIQIGESTAIETDDIFNHTELNEEKQLKQNIQQTQQGLERLDSLSSSNLNQGERRDSNSSAQVSFEASGVRPKKPCNCTKSACLKLYCDCFANGEFCNNCNCNNCFNNLAHEKQRQKAIKQCLDRNPSAFKPKIGRQGNETDRRHNRGCNCKRSGCLKNYCECYEAKIPCHEACKCIGCKNVDEDASGGGCGDVGHGTNSTTASFGMLAAHRRNEIRPSLKAKLAPLNALQSGSGKQPFSFVTSDVVEATTQCLLAQAEETERNGKHSQADIESMIIEEFGRCLGQIIEMANKAGATANGTGDSKQSSKAITADS